MKYPRHARHKTKFKSFIHCKNTYKFFFGVNDNIVEMESWQKTKKREMEFSNSALRLIKLFKTLV